MSKHSILLKAVVKYTVAAILIGVPLYPKFPLLKIPGTFVSVRLEDLLLAFSAILLFIILILNLKRFLRDKLSGSILFFLVVGFVSLINAIFLSKTVVPHIGFLHWTRRIEYFIPLFLGIESIRRNKLNLEFYMKIVFVVLVFVFFYGFGQKNLGWPIFITQNEEYSKGIALRYTPGSHINSTFAGHYDLASFLVLVLPFLISSFFLLKGKMAKVVIMTVTFCSLWLLVNTASRISLVSYLLGAGLALVIIKRYKMIPVVFAISILFIGFSSNLLSRYERLFEVTKEKFMQFNLINYLNDNFVVVASEEDLLKRRQITPTPTPVAVFEDRSTNIRLNVEWPRALRAFSKNPLLGTGYSSITLATDNDYLRLLGEVGLLGFFSFLLIFLQIGIRFLKLLPLEKNLTIMQLAFVAGIWGSLPGILVNALFIDLFEASKFATIFWLFIGFTLALVKNENAD